MVTISIETVGDERFIRGMTNYVNEMQDFTEPFKEIRDDFYFVEQRNFNAQGRPAPFAPLSPRYAKWKSRHYPGKPIMQLKGALIQSLTGVATSNMISVIKPKEAEFGTKVRYAHRHQQGIDMPQRKIVQLEETDKKRWALVIQTWAHNKLKKVEGVT